MKISNLLTAMSAISLSQFGEAVDNFPHTGTSLVEKNPYPPVRKDIARSLANKNEDIPGCAHMDVSTALFFAMDFERHTLGFTIRFVSLLSVVTKFCSVFVIYHSYDL